MAEQTERSFLKQSKVFLSTKKSSKGKAPGKAGTRFWKNVGLGFKTPREAIEGTYIDKKCPFTSNVSIRGRILTGTVNCTKMTRTITVRRDYLHFVPKYQRYEKRHSNLSAHVSPAFRVKEGDKVVIGQCRLVDFSPGSIISVCKQDIQTVWGRISLMIISEDVAAGNVHLSTQI
jgi:small subunit ribosomal protein S11e